MKDESLSPVAFRMEALPIAEPSPAMRESAGSAARRLVEITAGQQQTQRTLLDWCGWNTGGRKKDEGRMRSDLSCDCYGLTPAEIELMWQTAPPRMPIPQPTV